MRLTEAQRELLRETDLGTSCVKAHKPALKLVSLGLAAWSEDDEWAGILEITPAGRLALTSGSKPE